MTVYLRVHPDPKNYDVFDPESELMDCRLNDVDPEELTSTDIIYRMTPEHYRQFRGLIPDGMFFRVYPDKGNTDIKRGKLYDENFQRVRHEDIPKDGAYVVIPATKEEFDTFETLGQDYA